MRDFDDFLTWHSLRVQRKTGRLPAPLTLKTKHQKLNVACEVAHLEGCADLATLIQDRERVEELLDNISLRQSPGALRGTVRALMDFGEYAKARGLIPGFAVLPTDSPGTNPQKPIVVYTQEELDLMVGGARAWGLRWWAFLLTLMDTGRRVSEVLGLEWAWLNLSAEPPHFHLPNTKNGKQAYVPLTSRLVADVFTVENMEALQQEKRASNKSFARDPQTYPFPWSYANVNRRFAKFCVTLGIDPRGFHCFRHTKATGLLAKGVPIQAVSALLGHASVATTDRIYNHANALHFAQYLD